MFILLLDNGDLLGHEVSKMLIESKSDVVIDFLSETTEKHEFNNSNINFIHGTRRNNNIFSSLRKYYDIVIDLSAAIKNDIEDLFNNIEFGKYILKSTFQVYHFINENIIFNEELITEKYYQDVMDMYLNIKNDRKEIYAREKLKCEFELMRCSKDKKVNYIILRPSKIYSYEDKFLDLSWVMNRINNRCPIIFKNEDITKNNFFNPIYFKDLANVISEVANSDIKDSYIFNAAQDQLISLFDIIKCLAKINSKKFEHYILDNEHFSNPDLEDYKVPNIGTKVLSNQKLKQFIKFIPTDYEKWLKEISNHLIVKDDIKINNYIKEKEFIRKYLIVKKKVENIRIV